MAEICIGELLENHKIQVGLLRTKKSLFSRGRNLNPLERRRLCEEIINCEIEISKINALIVSFTRPPTHNE